MQKKILFNFFEKEQARIFKEKGIIAPEAKSAFSLVVQYAQKGKGLKEKINNARKIGKKILSSTEAGEDKNPKIEEAIYAAEQIVLFCSITGIALFSDIGDAKKMSKDTKLLSNIVQLPVLDLLSKNMNMFLKASNDKKANPFMDSFEWSGSSEKEVDEILAKRISYVDFAELTNKKTSNKQAQYSQAFLKP